MFRVMLITGKTHSHAKVRVQARARSNLKEGVTVGFSQEKGVALHYTQYMSDVPSLQLRSIGHGRPSWHATGLR